MSNAAGERRPTGTDIHPDKKPALWAVRSSGLLDAGAGYRLPFSFPFTVWIQPCNVGLNPWFAAALWHNLRAAATISSGMYHLQKLFHAHDGTDQGPQEWIVHGGQCIDGLAVRVGRADFHHDTVPEIAVFVEHEDALCPLH